MNIDLNGLILAFDESKYKRVPKGSAGGGRFTSKSGTNKNTTGGPAGIPIRSKKSASVGSKSPVKNNEKKIDKQLSEAKKLHKEAEKLHSPEQIAKDVGAAIAIEHIYKRAKPHVKAALAKAANLMKSRFNKEPTGVVTATLAEKAEPSIGKAIATGAKKAITKRPGWKKIAAGSKKLMNNPIVKKSAQLLFKTGKFATSVVIGAAPYLVKSAAAIGVFLATASVPELVLAGTLAAAAAYTAYKIRQKMKERSERRRLEKLFSRYGYEPQYA